MAIARWVGASNGVVHAVPEMLLAGTPDDIGGSYLSETNTKGIKRVSDGVLNDAACFRLRSNNLTYWIEKRTFALRRIESTGDHGDFVAKEATTLDPSFDVDITTEFRDAPKGGIPSM
jgi:hypothetical protein